jgi:hypothetical protein
MAISDPDPRLTPLLEEVYLGLVGSPELSSILIYKGARVLRQMLVTTRYSQDIDVTLRAEFVREHQSIAEQKRLLAGLISSALTGRFENSNPVRYTLLEVDLRLRPGRDVPDHWRMFATFIHVRDALSASAAELVAQIDISIAEQLSESAIADILVGDHTIYAYTLSRIAGEKLRAFLSCLPAYRRKIGQQSMERRAKDLFDLAKICAEHPLADEAFWRQAAREFVLACEFRKIDCAGMESFTEDWGVTEVEYARDERLKEVSIMHARATLQALVSFLKQHKYIPLSNPLDIRK